MRLFACLLFVSVLSAPTYAEYTWRRAHDITYVEMQAAEVSTYKMRSIRRKYRVGTNTLSPFEKKEAGLALLWKRDDGVYACNIYVLDLDDKRVLEHEIKHCHGWVHQ